MFLLRLFWRIKLAVNTKQLKKENLVIVNGFGTNSILLKELIDYLSEFFTVYFIDLPGFVPDKSSLLTISVDNYAKYVEERVKELDLKDYIFAGISFGFYVISKTNIEKRCKALFGVEPYIGGDSLEMNIIQKTFLDVMVNLLMESGIESVIWKSKYLPKLLQIFSECSQEELVEIIKEIDSKTFFETAKIILENHEIIPFKNRPYIIAINQNDVMINAGYTYTTLSAHVKELFLIPITTDHYPKKLTLRYFETHIPSRKVYEMIRWVRLLENNKKREEHG